MSALKDTLKYDGDTVIQVVPYGTGRFNYTVFTTNGKVYRMMSEMGEFEMRPVKVKLSTL